MDRAEWTPDHRDGRELDSLALRSVGGRPAAPADLEEGVEAGKPGRSLRCMS